MKEHIHEEIRTNLPQPVAVSWGAILAGLFTVLSTSWLLYLLGAAIGVSVTDAADDTLMDDGLPEIAIGWMLLSSLIAYFVGSALASRMANTVDEAVGMMHGFVVWSVATTVMVLLGYVGVSSLLQTGVNVVKTTGSAAASVVSATAQGVGAVGSAAASGVEGATVLTSSIVDSEVFQEISTRLKRSAAEAIANADLPEGADVSADEVRGAINDLDAAAIEQIVANLADDDQDGAAAVIAENTDFSREQADRLVAGAYTELEERLGDPDNDESLAADLKSQLSSGVAGVIASASSDEGTKVSQEMIAEAIEQLDAESMERAASLLVQGETEQATDVILEQTDLSREEVDAIVSGMERTYRRQMQELRRTVSDTVSDTVDDVSEAVDETVETASSYAQQLLWASFAASGLGLAISILGGWCGADTHRRMYYSVRSHGTATPTSPSPIA